MKRILILTILLMSSLAWAGSTTVVVGQGGGAPVAFCSGSVLFCEDFEGTDTSWDVAESLDCDGYDSDGVYCDDDTSVSMEGSEVLGVRGPNTDYIQEALSSSDQTELYFEVWWRVNNVSGVRSGPGCYTSGGYQSISLDQSWGTLRAIIKGGTAGLNTSKTDFAANTKYHIGVYWKIETAAGNNDGIVRVWMNTDGGEFDAADLILNNTSVDTGAESEGWQADVWRIPGPAAGYVSYTDNNRAVAGAPSWAYE